MPKISFFSFLVEQTSAEASKLNTTLGAAYETAVALHLHHNSASARNTDPAHVARIRKIQQNHDAQMSKLPEDKQRLVKKYAAASGNAYLKSLKKEGISSEHIHEVHHTAGNISNTVGRSLSNRDNPHDVMIKVKSKNNTMWHGASLKFKKGTLANLSNNSFDSIAKSNGIKKINTSGIWAEHKKNAGLSGMSIAQMKDKRKDTNIIQKNKTAQEEVGNHVASVLNNAKHEHAKAFLQEILKSKPDVPYHYVVGHTGTSESINDIHHYRLLNNAKKLNFEHTGGGKVKVTDHDGNHIATIENRPTHGPFISTQVNVKLGAKPKIQK